MAYLRDARLYVLVACLGLSACFKVGIEGGACKAGEACVCDLIGNCSKSCPDGNCNFECKGTGNCLFDCEGGGCGAVCQNTGNCILECPSNDCTIECRGTGTCIIRGAPDLSAIPRDFSEAPDLAEPADLAELVDGAETD